MEKIAENSTKIEDFNSKIEQVKKEVNYETLQEMIFILYFDITYLMWSEKHNQHKIPLTNEQLKENLELYSSYLEPIKEVLKNNFELNPSQDGTKEEQKKFKEWYEKKDLQSKNHELKEAGKKLKTIFK